MCASNDADIGAGELGAELVETPGRDAFGRAVDIEGGDRRVMGCLFSEVGYFHELVVDNTAGAAGRLRTGRMLELWLCVLDLPITLLR